MKRDDEPLLVWGAVMPEVLQVDKSHPHEAEDNQDQVKRAKLVHLSFLPCNGIEYNTKSDEQQGQGNTGHQGGPGDRLPGKHSEYEDRQAQLRRVVEELRQIIPGIFAHSARIAVPRPCVNDENAKK